MDTNSNKLQIINVAIKTLKAAEYNPRKISDADFAQLVESLRQYSLVEPLVVNSSPKRYGTVIGGHQRMRAAIELGYETCLLYTSPSPRD